MDIVLMGCGSVGGIIASRLLAAGQPVTIVTHNEVITEHINRYGLRVYPPRPLFGLEEPCWIPARAMTSLNGRACFDVALLAMKAPDMAAAVRQVKPLLRPDGFVVPMQNGVPEDVVAKLVGPEHMVSAVLSWGSIMEAPGVYRLSSTGKITLGELDGSLTTRLRTLSEVLQHVAPTVLSTNIYGVRWSKLVINAAMTPQGLLTGLEVGRLLQHAVARHLFLVLASEVIDVATAANINLEKISGVLEPRHLYLPPQERVRLWGFNSLLHHLIISIMGFRIRHLRSSMLHSYERGRPTEVDYLNGYVVRMGLAHGVSTPANAAVVKMVHQIEAGQRPLSLSNLEEVQKL